MKRRLRWLLLVLVLAAGLSGAYLYSQSTGNAPRFRTTPVTRGNITASVITTGNLNAVITVQVGSQVSGQVKELFADFNSEVKRGQLVARIDPAELRGHHGPGQGRAGGGRGGGAQSGGPGGAGAGRGRQRPGRPGGGPRPDGQIQCCPPRCPPRPHPEAGPVRPGADRPQRPRHRPGRARSGRGPAGVQPRPGAGPGLRHQGGRGPVPGHRGPAQRRGSRGAAEGRRAPAGPGQPRVHVHPRAGGRRGDLTQRGRRPDGGGEPPGAHSLHDRAGPHQDADRHERRRGRHRPHAGGPARDLHGGLLPGRDLQRPGRADPEGLPNGAERGDLQRGHRGEQPRPQAPARHSPRMCGS